MVPGGRVKRSPRYVRFRGRWMRINEAAKAAGLSLELVLMRQLRGWPPDRALETPARAYKRRDSVVTA